MCGNPPGPRPSSSARSHPDADYIFFAPGPASPCRLLAGAGATRALHHGKKMAAGPRLAPVGGRCADLP